MINTNTSFNSILFQRFAGKTLVVFLLMLLVMPVNFVNGQSPTLKANQPIARQNPFPMANVVDLTHTLTEDFPYIPVPGITFPFQKTPIATIEKNGVAANRWNIHEHIGTQIDAPSHFVAGGKSLDQIPIKNLIAPLAVIDISDRAKRDPDAAVTIEDIKAWEAKYGRLPQNAAVFMYSGWDAKVSDPKTFLNMDESNTLHFPGFSPEAASFLAKERQVVGIGVDTISFDPGKDKTYKTHRLWLAAGAGDKWAVECVANLNRVPPSGATVIVGATKVAGATGGPVRLIAVWADNSKLLNENTSALNEQIIGTWKSVNAEDVGNEIYITREFKFTNDRWQVESQFYSDKKMLNPLFSFAAEGHYTLGNPSNVVQGATNAIFFFAKKTLTLLTNNPDAIKRFRLDQCGLTKNATKDISGSGCSDFTSIAVCGQEYDLVKIDGKSLSLGARPADRNMCTEDKRPKALGLPVVKQ